MILVVDIGNTNISFGVFEDDEILLTFRLTTGTPRTSDEFGVVILDILKGKGIEIDSIKGVAIASVVPQVMYSFNSAIVKYLGLTPMIISPGIKTGIKIANENPKEVGADRIVDCAAAYELHKGPVIVIDYGTATTYDVVSKEGAFVAGITAPGIMASAKSLWEGTAKLPEVEIVKPESILAKNTITSMQAGLVYGQIGQTEFIIDKIKEELLEQDVLVVATGGFGNLICKNTDKINVYDPHLTLKGLNIIYKKNARRDRSR